MGATLTLSDVKTPLDKVAVVTGGNQGLGFASAKLLALLGCKVVLGCRSEERALKAIEDIKAACEAEGVKDPYLRFISLDLDNLQSVRDFSDEFRATGLPLHILICNAGIFGIQQSFTEDGFERQFQVNYLSHLLLTVLLLPVMKKSGPDCRIVYVTSKLYQFAKLEMDNIQGERAYSRLGFYNKSKLYLIMTMYALQRRLSDSNVTISCLHPGSIKTNMQMTAFDNTWFGWIFFSFVSVYYFPPIKYFLHKCGISREADQAGLSIAYLAVSPKMAGIRDVYYNETVLRPTSAESRNEESQEMLLEYSLQRIQKFVPEEVLTDLNLIQQRTT